VAVDKAEFRQALGHFASSVTVVTAATAGVGKSGITVTAFSSLSLEPPLILVCLDKRAKLHDQLGKGGFFAVHVLSEGQELISRRFAVSEGDQFAGLAYTTGVSGAPLLDACLAVIECRITDLLPGGDHTIFVAEVESSVIREGKPLLYFRGGYAQLK